MKAFLAHSKVDRSFALQLDADLRGLGLTVWLDERDVKVGTSIVHSINHALSEIDILIIVLSPDALVSEWVLRELNATLMHSILHQNVRLIPVLYKSCIIPPIIGDIKYADFTHDYAHGFSNLCAGLGLNKAHTVQSSPPTSIAEALEVGDHQLIRSVFPYTFEDYPNCLFKNGRLDLLTIVGSASREHGDDMEVFRSPQAEIDVFGRKYSISRHQAQVTIRDATRAADLMAFLAFRYASNLEYPGQIWHEQEPLCVMDIAVTDDMLKHNLILVGGSDVNLIIPVATIAFRQRFGVPLPIRFRGDDNLYFTCDEFVSEMSGRGYPRQEDSGFMHCGYVLMVANPWAPEKVMILAIGTRGTGTQAALLALMRNTDDNSLKNPMDSWRTLSSNNKHYPQVPAKVVCACRANIVEGTTYTGRRRDIPVSSRSRISQRHIITGYEYLE